MIFFANCFDAGDLDHSTIRLPSCLHIQSAAECSISEYPTISLSIEALSSFPFPKMVKEQLEEMGKTHGLDHLIMQVSEKSFAVYAPFHRDQSSLRILHVRFDKQGTFHCQCSNFKRDGSLSCPTAPNLSKRCIHLYMCFWAFLCKRNLQQEFGVHLHEGMFSTIFISLHCCTILH